MCRELLAEKFDPPESESLYCASLSLERTAHHKARSGNYKPGSSSRAIICNGSRANFPALRRSNHVSSLA